MVVLQLIKHKKELESVGRKFNLKCVDFLTLFLQCTWDWSLAFLFLGNVARVSWNQWGVVYGLYHHR